VQLKKAKGGGAKMKPVAELQKEVLKLYTTS